MKKAAVIRGDGTGPELVDAMMRVIGAVDPDIEFIPCEEGEEVWKENGGDSLIPDETWDILLETDACFKGPTTTPGVVGAPRSVAVSIRQRFDLYANVPPDKGICRSACAAWRCRFRRGQGSNGRHVLRKRSGYNR
jgi:isocitrate dehydrogenase